MLSEASLRVLESFHLPNAQLGRSIGEHLAREAGQSIEFHDFRPYQAGDALRYVDWKVYRRTGRKYTRIFQAEHALDVHIVLDDSASMHIGAKIDYAKTLAAMLIFLARGNRCQLHGFSQLDVVSQPDKLSPPRESYARPDIHLVDLWQALEKIIAEGAHSSNNAIHQLIQGIPSKSGQPLVFVLSDLFDEAYTSENIEDVLDNASQHHSLQHSLHTLRLRRMGGVFLHIVAEEDINPLKGELELHDNEWGGKLNVSPAQIRAYQKQVQDCLHHCQRIVHEAGFHYQRFVVPKTIDEAAVLMELKDSSWLRH